MTRPELEHAALVAVCPCWATSLEQQLEETDDDTLKQVIEDPQYLHRQEQFHNPISEADYLMELGACPSQQVECGHEDLDASGICPDCDEDVTFTTACERCGEMNIELTDFGAEEYCDSCKAAA